MRYMWIEAGECLAFFLFSALFDPVDVFSVCISLLESPYRVQPVSLLNLPMTERFRASECSTACHITRGEIACLTSRAT